MPQVPSVAGFFPMKNKTFILSALCASVVILSATAFGQVTPPAPQDVITNFVSPSILGGIQQISDALKLSSTNWIVEIHALRAPALPQKYGGGLGLYYPINDFVYAGVRADWVNGGFWMPSGSAGLQLPLKLASWFKITPFTYAGVAVPLSGAKFLDVTVPGKVIDNNGEPTAILGYGIAFQVYEPKDKRWNISLAIDNEVWSGFKGEQHRYALMWHKKF